jgi:hypothetical protein
MRVSAFRRIVSYLLDILPIFAVLSLLFTFVVGDILKPENHDVLMEEYQQITAEYGDVVDPYRLQFEAGELTEEEYQAILDPIIEDYNEDTREHITSMILYFQNGFLYYLMSFTVLYYLYSVVTKGKTVGRKLMKIELDGKINWWTLLVREVIWKTGYYMLTLLIGGIILDIAMISLSNKKRAPRDIVTGITLKYEGVTYPF